MFRKLLIVNVALALLASQTAFAEITHNGTVSLVRNYAATADASINESWTMIQVAGLTSGVGCASGDEGAGDLAYLAIPDPEKTMVSLIVSAYLSGAETQVVVDETNLYEGKCRVKHFSIGGIGQPIELIYNSLDPNNKAPSMVLSANKESAILTLSTDGWRSALAVAPLSPGGKYYWEATWVLPNPALSNSQAMFGMASDADVLFILGYSPSGYSWYHNDNAGGGRTYHNSAGADGFVAYSAGTRLMFAFDPNAGKLWFGVDGVWQGDPAAGTGERFSSITGAQYPGVTLRGGSTGTLIFDPVDFLHTPPSGFVPSTVSQ